MTSFSYGYRKTFRAHELNSAQSPRIPDFEVSGLVTTVFLFPKPLVPRAIRKKYTGDRWSGYELARESIKQTLSLAKSDGVQNSSAASPEIQHRTVWRTWLFIAYSDKSFLTCVTWKKVQYYFELWFRFCLRKMLSLGSGLRHQEWSFDPHEHSFLSLYPNAL